MKIQEMVWRWRIEARIMRLTDYVRRLIRLEENQMSALDDILDRTRAQKTLLDSLKVFIDGIKANQGDPVKLAQIVSELDANNVAIDVMDNVEPTV